MTIETWGTRLVLGKAYHFHSGIAHITLKLSQMKEFPSDEVLEEAKKAAEKQLRKTILDKGGFVNTIEWVKLINGDQQVNAMFVMKGRNH